MSHTPEYLRPYWQPWHLDPAGNPLLLLAARQTVGTLAVQFEHEDPEGTFWWNQAQIFRNPYSSQYSDVELVTHEALIEDRAKLRVERGVEHCLDIERAFWFGKLATEGPEENPRRFTRGILQAEPTSQGQLLDPLTEAELEGWVEFAVHQRHTAFASAELRSQIDLIMSDRLHTVPLNESYAIPVVQIATAWGTLNLIKHKLFGPAHVQWVDLDVASLKYRPFRQTRIIKHEWKDQYAGVDGPIPDEPKDWWIEEYLTEAAIQMQRPKDYRVVRSAKVPAPTP